MLKADWDGIDVQDFWCKVVMIQSDYLIGPERKKMRSMVYSSSKYYHNGLSNKCHVALGVAEVLQIHLLKWKVKFLFIKNTNWHHRV